MRLWYQSFSRFSEFGAYSRVLREITGAAADPGVSVHVAALEKGGGIADQYRYLEHLDVREVVDNGLRAQREGFDAFLIGNIADPGILELREVLSIPVLGLCETTLSLGAMMGASFSLVTVNEKFTPRVLENINRYGFAGRLAAVDTMRLEHLPDLASGFAGPEERAPIVQGFVDAAKRGVARGAEVVIPAGGVVMALLAHAGVHQVEGAPILNGCIALVKMGETAVKLQRQTGSFISKRLSYAPPRGALLREVRAFYGQDVYPGVE